MAIERAYLNIAWPISIMPDPALSLVVISVAAFGDQLWDHVDLQSASSV